MGLLITMNFRLKNVLSVYLIITVTAFQAISQTKIPFENKNWKWLTPENIKIYSIAIDEDTI